MAKGTRDIRRKIKSVKSTKQITKAMELVSASKMRRAVSSTLALRPYANLARALLEKLAEKTKPESHPLLAKREIKNVLVIVVTPDKGLCGGLNTQLFRSLNEYLKKENGGNSVNNQARKISFVTIGKKGADFLRRMGKEIIAAYPAMSLHPSIKEVLPVSKATVASFLL